MFRVIYKYNINIFYKKYNTSDCLHTPYDCRELFGFTKNK